MKAAVYRRYGAPDVVRLEDVPKPVPKPGELLIKIYTSTVTAADWRLRRASPVIARFFNGLLRPKKFHILGWEFAGRVAAIGPEVSRFNVGDDVFGSTVMRFGTHAEFCCVPEAASEFVKGFVALKPTNLSHAEVAAVPIGCITVQGFFKKAELKSRDKILIYGASGSVGTYAVQIAKILGAHVTGVCSTENMDLVASLGADRVIDYTKEDLANDERQFDVVFDAVGFLSSARAKRLLRDGGRYVTVKSAPPKLNYNESIAQFIDWLRSGRLKAVIDRYYPLEQIVQAHTYVEAGHKKGNVIIAMP
jgi:NADPH:quinone reductase-like Zn-dependent oxidoreductase